MFNDNVQMGFFDVYDQYILNVLYDPRIVPGMNVEQVLAVLPQVLPAVRAWVSRVNDLGSDERRARQPPVARPIPSERSGGGST